MRVVKLAEVKRQRRARVYEHALAVAAKKERNRLVHVLVLRTHAVARRDEHVLAPLVKACERLAAAEDLFVVLQLERRRDATREIARATHEGKRDRSDVSGWIADVLCARQQIAALVVDLNVPRLLDDADSAVRAGVSDLAIVLLDAPRVIFRHWTSEHQRLAVAQRHRAR